MAGTAFHAGVIDALHEATGWDARTASLIIGTSAGSTSGALVRAGIPPEDFVPHMNGEPVSEVTTRILTKSRQASGQRGTTTQVPSQKASWSPKPAAAHLVGKAIRDPRSVRPLTALAGLLPVGATTTTDISRSFDAMHPYLWPRADLWICASQLSTGQRVVFGRDDIKATVGQAVAASCAIPGYFEPVSIDGKKYVDGGVYSFNNLDLVTNEGFDLVIVSAPMSTADFGSPRGDLPLRAGARHQLQREIVAVRASGTPVIALEPTAADRRAMGYRPMDPSRRGSIAITVKASALTSLLTRPRDLLQILRTNT